MVTNIKQHRLVFLHLFVMSIFRPHSASRIKGILVTTNYKIY